MTQKHGRLLLRQLRGDRHIWADQWYLRITSKDGRQQQRFQWCTGKAGGYVAMKSAQYFISNCEAMDRPLINIEDILEINTVDDTGCAVRRGIFT